MRGSQSDPKPAPGLVASALVLGVAAGAGAEVAPTSREHEQVVTRARQAYRIDMGGTMDGANTRDPVGYGVYGQAWEPNRFVLMENVGDHDVANPWILVDGRRDWRSVDHILSGIIEPGMAEGEKARAIWDFARRHRYHSTPGTDEVKDTVKMLNVYGYTLCWDAAYTMSNLWQRAGLKIRRGLPHGHCTTEVFYDGAYHLLDSDEHLLVLMRDNRTVAGEAEISRDHDLMKRSHAYGILRAEDRRTNEFSASLFCYLGPRSGGRPYIGGHRMEITLRPGEGLRWEWADRGRYHGLGDRPPRLANGRLHYRPWLDSGFARWTESSSNLEGGGGGLRVLDPGEEASVVYRLRSPYVFVGGRVRVQLAPGSGAWRLEMAREGQDDWTHLADVPADGELSLDGGFPRPTACYEYRLRLRGSGGGIAALEIESDLQMAPLSLPALELGANEIVYTDETPGPRRVRLAHAWQERDDLTPPPAPARALHPPAGGEVAGTQIRFRWEPVPEAADYHFELSRHADMRRALSPVFEKLSSRTPAAGQAHWQIPFEGLLNPGETCYWRVRARNAGGLWGPWSEVWSFTPRAPGVPRDLELVTDRETRSITLHWREAAEGARPQRYEVYGSDERGFTASLDSYAVFTGGSEARDTPGNRLATTGDTSIVVAGPGVAPEAGNRGFYRVVAVDADGIRSGPSDYVEAPRPFIYSTPPVSIAAGERRLYRVGVIRSMGDLRSITDPEKQGDPGAGGRYQAAFRDGDELRFVLDEGPGFIALDRETGVMTLAPGAADVSTHTVTIRVQNRNGGVDVQGWDLRVADAPPVAEPVP